MTMPTLALPDTTGRRTDHVRAMKRACSLLIAFTFVVVSQPSTAGAAPSITQSSAFDAGDLTEGSVGPRVAQVQEALIQKGSFLTGGADGVFGAATTKAIADFQTWNGLPRTGELDDTTVRRLGLSSGASTSSTSTSSGGSSSSYADLSLGSQGQAVVDVQQALLATGLVIRGGADGIFGQATVRALKAFQSVNGMTQTGQMSERAARLLDPGSSAASAASTSTSNSNSNSNSNSSSWTQLSRFPVQGHCAYGDTWHAPRGNGRVHEGVDIIAATGKLLYAVADGTITTQYWDYPGRLSGNGLKLTAADGTYFLYLHMAGFAPGIARGTQVKAGDVIGFVGNTGSSATPHLHFEIHPRGGGAINPYPYVRAIDDCSNTRAKYQSSFT